MQILAIDIGGSNIKAMILDEKGAPVSEYKKLETPAPSTPANVMEIIKTLAKNFTGYDAISAGFPGYIKDGVVKTAPNLGTEQWKDYDLQAALTTMFKRPAKVVNDADLQGIAVASGKGLEMVITLGTGFGTALLKDGKLLPHLEIGQHPIKTNKTYDNYIGQKAFENKGKAHWNERLKKVINILKTVYNYDRLYISGGNAKNIDFKLDDNITIANNRDGIKGGAMLWKDEHKNAK
ncbi:ROK family protein [Panacibacter ginsenosidivorans]|uniref:ROK family protein n=1 Tax=Panacibacter ginsenosidivorans TaxID=1813871 RepID=A0A5B8VBC7_9BACT|nr:ROK family protein [Panacibacter ginsenosidivorans]QEC68303.1 ROK family protein [Panacibacter ginsenosidivorans]